MQPDICHMTAPSCSCCGRPRTRRADNRGWTGYHGYCPACAERWRVAGRPAEGPPAASSGTERAARISAGLRRWHATHEQSQAARGALVPGAGGGVLAQRKANRVQDYAWLTSFGESREQAAARVGVSVWTARDYERELAGMAAREAA